MSQLDAIRARANNPFNTAKQGIAIAAAPTDIARLLTAVDAVTALADKWQEQFPYKASELRAALTTALGGGDE